MRPRLVHVLLVSTPLTLSAQTGSVRGRVIDEQSKEAAQDVRLQAPGRSVAIDGIGRFALNGMAFGPLRLIALGAAYHAETVYVTLDVDDLEIADIVVRRRAQSLPSVAVVAESSSLRDRISGFSDRRRLGVGTFLDRAAIEAYHGRRTGDLLVHVPSLRVVGGNSLRAWVATRRPSGSVRGGGAAVSSADRALGARTDACYMDVYLNGAIVYASTGGAAAPLFDVNSLLPEAIESIEVYASAAQIPPQFNRPAGGCGVIVIWTK